MYTNIKELLQLAEGKEKALWQIILENEIILGDLNKEEIYKKLELRYQVMFDSAHKALERTYHTVGSLIEGISMKQHSYTEKEENICGSFINRVMALALSCSETNASLGKICAAPTAGSCGIIPAVLISMSEKLNCSREQVLQGLLTASGIGAIITKNATVSGAEGGCQAECGVAAAMAAAAAVEMAGGSPAMAVHGCTFALINVMGLVCDPVAGLVQVPCAQRNASQAVNALISADMALAGMKSIIPADEVVDAMYRVGKSLPYQLRETALGGIAVTPTGKKIKKDIFGGV